MLADRSSNEVSKLVNDADALKLAAKSTLGRKEKFQMLQLLSDSGAEPERYIPYEPLTYIIFQYIYTHILKPAFNLMTRSFSKLNLVKNKIVERNQIQKDMKNADASVEKQPSNQQQGSTNPKLKYWKDEATQKKSTPSPTKPIQHHQANQNLASTKTQKNMKKKSVKNADASVENQPSNQQQGYTNPKLKNSKDEAT